jgi:DHA2 family lincomycin resistance protein-like MFS transporter
LTSGALLLPLFLQSTIGVSTLLTALIILPITLLKALLNPIGSKFSKKVSSKNIGILGSILLIISCIPFVFFTVNINLYLVAILYIIRITGLTLLLFPILAYSLKGIDSEEYTQGLSIINSNRQIVAALGTTALLACASFISPSGTVSIKGINLAFFIQLIIFIIALIISIFFIKPKENLEN